jgi:FkbM family methyltransferase
MANEADSSGVRRLVLSGANRLGVEGELHRLHTAALQALERPSMRRNRREDERIRLLAAAALRPDANCVDVGANEGKLLAIFTEVAPQGRHIAFEPVPWLADSLAQRFPAVDVRSSALANERGTTSFVVHRKLASRSSLRSVGYSDEDTETLTVQVDRLDDVLPAGYVPALIKIDVEGAEHLVLEGARTTLARHRPIVIFEHQKHTAAHYDAGPGDLFRLLAGELEMRIFDMDGEGPYTAERFGETYETGRRWNFFARG